MCYAPVSSEPLLVESAAVYYACAVCAARFLDPGAYISPREEKAHYDLHQNDVFDPAYRRFLSRLFDPVVATLSPGARGLDYGCGPGPALAAMFVEAGYETTVYDPFYAEDPAVLADTYDFITCSETAEHFHDPAGEFDRFDRLLRPGGVLGVMTCFQTDDEKFRDWHYRKDPTHVVFYRAQTLRFISKRRGWCCEIPRKDVALMRKP